MVDISIVSGTYNRIDFLKQMVTSARQSFKNCYGLSYEFVLVDGNSQDGTQEWCKTQSDIRLIEHDKLYGAVKAFNDGAFAASGQYVILANDDIIFVGESILTAWIYMQSHKNCGVGCFEQDRNRQHLPDNHPNKWDTETMPVVIDGKQSYAPYGQVCIVPKWLGDQVGWWGDYLYTYGGDNELSSKVYQAGFLCSPIPETRIHDLEVEDDLRRINNQGRMTDPKKTGGHNPDSWAWGKRWRNEALNLVGATVTGHSEDHTERKERILYLPIYEQGWPVQKIQKRGLREALAKVALVVEYDYVHKYHELGINDMMFELIEICRQIKPTIILTQIHNGGQINASHIHQLRQHNPDAKFINWNGDFWPDNLLSDNGILLAKAFDWQLIINRDVLKDYQAIGINAAYWQIGYEPDGYGHQANVNYDVVFLANGYSKERQQFVGKLKKLNFNLGLYGNGWVNGWSQGQCTYDFITGCKIYQGSKISIGDSQWPDSGFVSNRVFQALVAGGAALAYQWFAGMEKLGLVDGETCIIWRDFSELEQKIYYYLDNENERKRIADNGQRLALERHSFDVRVTELFDLIGEKQEHWRL